MNEERDGVRRMIGIEVRWEKEGRDTLYTSSGLFLHSPPLCDGLYLYLLPFIFVC